MQPAHSIDLLILRWINIDLASPYLDPVMRFFSGNVPWLIIGGLLLIWFTKNFSWTNAIALIFLILAIVATDAICHSGIKIILTRGWGRPCLTVPWVRLAVEKCGNWFTFPSNHAANSMCLAVFWSFLKRKRSNTRAAVGMALLVGLSRVYVGVHYPSDVLTGMAIGGVLGSLFYFLNRRVLGIHTISKIDCLPQS